MYIKAVNVTKNCEQKQYSWMYIVYIERCTMASFKNSELPLWESEKISTIFKAKSWSSQFDSDQ